ncbi:hypothetical protein P5673_017998 [Acropora cervicornis]|uniref:Uncharacterized protein n=1 Tax=Acropora cervicornis TaxID=6130 RepID=A0AAD9QDP9_ACRCE|nr:hypothetical protein P5673_017998 [Acropora cervicornis]
MAQKLEQPIATISKVLTGIILNIKWQDRRTKSSVLEEASVRSIAIEAYIIKNQLRCTGNLVRMPSSSLPKRILYGDLTYGRRSQGEATKTL